MMKRHVVTILAASLVALSALACAQSSRRSQATISSPTVIPEQVTVETPGEPPLEPTTTLAIIETLVSGGGESETEDGEPDTVFPLPEDVKNFMGSGGESMVNFLTSLSIEEVIEFYREAFADQGLTEREILTTISDSSFSMVFDGSANGRAIVIQGVNLGVGTNVNIRFDDV